MTPSPNFQRSLNDFQLREGIYFPSNYQELNETLHKQKWDKIGETYYGSQKIDTIDQTSPIKEDYTLLTGKLGGTWDKFPHHKSVDGILEIGCGYGRTPLHLSKGKNLQCQQYFGIDISESLLKRLLKFKQEYDFFPGAHFSIICASAEQLPLPDDSIDLVISNCVFMHIPDAQLRNLLADIVRVIKPGGMFFFNHSFHNKNCPSHQIHNLIRNLNFVNKNPIYLKQYSAKEIEEMFIDAGMKAKCPEFVIEPTTEYAILPETIKGIPLPWAKKINQGLKPKDDQKENLAYGFSAYSIPLI